MTQADLIDQAITQAEGKIGELSIRERAVARAAIEFAFELSLQSAIDSMRDRAKAEGKRHALEQDSIHVCYQHGFTKNPDRIAALNAIVGGRWNHSKATDTEVAVAKILRDPAHEHHPAMLQFAQRHLDHKMVA